MTTIAHISDLHFGTELPTVVAALLESISELKPDLVVASGDLTQRARAGQFQAARTLLDRMGYPWLAVPGNHDVPLFDPVRRLFSPLGRFRRFITTDSFPYWENEEIAVLGINTARIFKWKSGRISYQQMERIREAFCGSEKQMRILAMHHPMIPPSDSPSTSVVGRAEKMLRRADECRPDLVLSGHLHESYSGDTYAVYRSAWGSTLVLQAGTAVSGRVRREPNSFNEIRLDENRAVLTVRIWDGRRFEARPSERFHRNTGIWVKS